ncbi:HBS1-like protein isoform X2 [Acropora muricata]|uniref:HBS1-like protein isoform X2 n=1 Tax=Acropora muricata TaxID=159855 RepID=UPI0034E3D883
MARHRNYRNYAYEDDLSDDVYGHSVEDYDISVSPGTAEQFMFRRSNSRDPNLSAYMVDRCGRVEEEEEEDEDNDEDDLLTSLQDYRRPQLDPISEAKLSSCMDQLQSILGENLHEPTAVSAIVQCNYDVDRALDYIFSQEEKQDQRKNLDPFGTEGTYSHRKEKEDQVRHQPPVITHISRDSKKEGTADSTVSVVTPSKDKTIVGFATPIKKSRESSPDEPMEVENELKPPEPCKTKGTGKSKEQALAEAHEDYNKRCKGKILLNLVVIGHVDAGKSTLMGHLLYSLGDVSKKSMHKYEIESKKAGKASFAYAWVLDETGEERERGVTMDVGLTRFETDTKLVTLMDAPGHKDFIPNMITGAAQADVAILVVGSSTGEFESGFEAGGQTREHALLVRSLGVTQLIVAVNKLDNVGWSEDRYNHIVGKLKHFLKQAGFKDCDVAYVPCSGLTGENLVAPSTEPPLKQWYNGPTLLNTIDNFKPPKRELEKPFRFCVSDVYKGMGTGINASGKLEAGKLHSGDKIAVMPSGGQGLVKAFTIHDEPAQLACAGDHVTLTLSGLDTMHVGVGSVICPPSSPIKCTTKLKARILVFNIRIPITKGFTVLYHYKTLNEPAVIKRLCSVLHKSTGEVLQKKPRCLTKNSNAEVIIHTYRPVCVELYKDYKDLGRFMLRYSGETIAAGVVTEILDKSGN